MRRATRTGARACLAVAVSLAVFAGAAAESPAAAPTVRRTVDVRLRRAIRQEMRRGAMPGVIVGIKQDGLAPWIVARGVANLLTRAPMRASSHIRIGSVTKAFVTTLLLRLAQARRLSLDDPISRYVSGIPNGNTITLRQLADMTSGLPDVFASLEFTKDYLLGETFTPGRLVGLGLGQPRLFAPGTGWAYSNTNTDLLGMVIEKVTRQPLAKALKQRIFRPLGLRGTSLPSGPGLPRPFPDGYTLQTVNGRLADATFNTPTATWAAGGIVSTVPDLLRAARMFGTGQPVLSRASQRQRERWVRLPPNSPIQRYGVGVFDFNGWIGHNGGIPGYTAIAWYLPRRHLSLVVAVNSDIHVGPRRTGYAYEPASELAHALTRILSPRHVAPAAVKVRGSRVTSVT